jgi:hypothetical protein
MRLLIVLLALTGTVHAQGASYLGLCHKDFDCKAVERTWQDSSVIFTGWLENTFGASCKCGERLLSSTKHKVIRVHLINSPCMRNKRCGKYEVLYRETAASATRKVLRNDERFYRKFNAVLDRFKKRIDKAKDGLTCYLSPCLECDLNVKARKKLLNLVRLAVPQCIPVDSPLRGRCVSGEICERHGESPVVSRACITDLDGVDGSKIVLARFVRLSKDCDISFYWEPWMNCIRGSFVDPRKRNCKFDSSYFDKTRRILCQSFLRPLFGTCSL